MKFWFKRTVYTSKKANQIIDSISRDEIRSIAVLRHAALGDMVLTRCFLIELKKAFPNAIITLSITSNYTRGTPEDLVDRVHIVYGSDKKDISLREKINNFKELGEHDLLFDLAATNRSFKTCLLNKAKLKFGFPYRKFQSRLFYDISVPRSDLSFEVDDMLSMLHAIGIKTAYPHDFGMPGVALVRERPYVIYFTGSADLNRCWPQERYSALVEQMSQRHPGYDHLVLDGLHDYEKADVVLGSIQKRENLGAIAADNIEETISLLKGAAMVVSNDTGIRNLAITCNTTTIGIFFASHPYRYWPRHHGHDVVIPESAGYPSVDETLAVCDKAISDQSE